MSAHHSARTLTALGYFQFTVGAIFVSLDNAVGGIPTDAILMTISVETNAIRYRDDGTAPTATVGEPMLAGQAESYIGNRASMKAFEMIAQSGTATVNVRFYK